MQVSQDYALNVSRMMRPTYPGSIVIVEGPHDAEVFKNFINDDFSNIVIAYKQEYALHAIKQLNREKIEGVLVILDADFLWLDNKVITEPNVVITDTHDLYTMIFSTKSLNKLVNTFCDEKEIEKLPMPISDLLLNRASTIGIFRWLSSPNQKNYRFTFWTLNINDCINKNTLEILIDNLIRIILRESNRDDLDLELIKREIREIDPNQYNKWNLCQGHDLLNIFFIGIKNKFGNKTGKKIDFSYFEICFRLSYEYEDFSKTKLHKSIKEWEKSNPKFHILKK